MRQVAWQKSSFSGNGPGNDCVEVADLLGAVAVRESDEPSRSIAASPEAFAALIRRLKAGECHG
ncbi:DUF397 domain-containing protein [Streptomyces telluris]|uniref:DUF397 domain-containing protein n=2 Tax=Streptomyces telluris TaxID=2720021 RepID=A0A9X2RMG5_9ACTN|nr:DUF397 domain-containing protein [Streptomyces telluris]MCQ8769336.1 DUF397 domain-containing protein [Streptomyces telluris]NJP80079.1 DUF397 domain-containing protein [Streptomyces telluris]